MKQPGRPLERVELIVVHSSATEDGRLSMSWDAIRRFHTDHKGWDDIGYHGGAEFIRDAPQVLVGRPEHRTGAHAGGLNDRSLGFVFVGDYDDDPPAEELLEVAARRWFVPVLARYGLTPAEVRPHREFNKGKTCPGLAFDMETLREIIAEVQKG